MRLLTCDSGKGLLASEAAIEVLAGEFLLVREAAAHHMELTP